ncbi:MAG TPA: 6-phosphofructokinase, partial [Bdellovibrionales bacterium]|nr:6-phosphofructokinase [Bdellovibrionales bacterium]
MNAALRAVVRLAINDGLEVMGISRGYLGMLENEIFPLDRGSMANIIQRGGTVIKTGRSPEFMKIEGRKKAFQHLQQHGIQALVCIGGDGSFRGAHALWQEHQVPVVGLPGTIDNDVHGTDVTIGFDTAVNTALDAIDRVRDTAASHDRLFIVEVMGRNSGFIACEVGLAGGAEDVIIPENQTTVEDIIAKIQRGIARGKTSSIVVIAEGQKPGRAYDLADAIRKKSGMDAKVCILGHVQRGGSPTAADRVLASRLGAAAVQALRKGICDVMIGLKGGEVSHTPLEETFSRHKTVRK